MTDHDVESKTKKVEKLSDGQDYTHLTAACDVGEAVLSLSTATFDNDNDNDDDDDDDDNGGKEQVVETLETKEASADAREPGDLGDAIAALDLTSFDDIEGDDISKDEASIASINTGSREVPTNPIGTGDLCNSSDWSAVAKAQGARNVEKKNKSSRRNPSDVFVPLRPEGVCTAEEPNGTRAHSTTSQDLRVRFTGKATLRGYERGSIPSPKFQPSSSRGSNQPAIGPNLNTTSDSGLDQTAELKDKSRLIECEEELDLLERSLPTKSQDPNRSSSPSW